MQLVLASTSPFRKELLGRLRVPFATASPLIDESRRAHELPSEMVARLAHEKAAAVAPQFEDALIIGSDQCAVLNGSVLGKPGGFEANVRQLQRASGRIVTFYTGLCLLNTTTGRARTDVIPFKVHFRTLRDAQITRYVMTEQPYNCAGGFKSEGLGIALFARLEGDDPSALIGLPLTTLITMLGEEGMDVLDAPSP